MTKDQYYDMCRQMGSEPVEEEIPLEFDDLTIESQKAIELDSLLSDNVSEMSGHLMGKDFSGVDTFLNVLGIKGDGEKYIVFLLLSDIVNTNKRLVSQEIEQHKNNKPKNSGLRRKSAKSK